MRDSPRPVIMVSSLTQEGAETTLEALELGAFDYLPKQSSFVSLDIVKIRDDLIAKVKAAAESGKRRRLLPKVAPSAAKPAVSLKTAHHIPATMVALGTSTGGPKALQEIHPMLPGDLSAPVVIVQHVPTGFTGPFARRLNTLCKITVREAEQNDPLEAGTVYIAPAGQHLTFARRGSSSKATIRLGPLPENSLHMPSVDVMMLSAAETFRSLCMGVILTGMGADGAKGMGAIQKEGGSRWARMKRHARSMGCRGRRQRWEWCREWCRCNRCRIRSCRSLTTNAELRTWPRIFTDPKSNWAIGQLGNFVIG